MSAGSTQSSLHALDAGSLLKPVRALSTEPNPNRLIEKAMGVMGAEQAVLVEDIDGTFILWAHCLAEHPAGCCRLKISA